MTKQMSNDDKTYQGLPHNRRDVLLGAISVLVLAGYLTDAAQGSVLSMHAQ